MIFHNQDFLKDKGLRLSYFEGIFSGWMAGLTQEYLVPFLLFLGGGNSLVGALSALANLSAALVQVRGPDLTERLKSRKLTVGLAVLVQILVLAAMAVVALTRNGTTLFIILVLLFSAAGALAAPAWGSLVSDLVPEKTRGAYFGWRNRNIGFITVCAGLSAGLVLHATNGTNPALGFLFVFSLACGFRLLSWLFLMRMKEPSFQPVASDHFTLYDFVSRAKKSNFARFVLFISLMSFSVNLASPFFAVLMLRDLSFSYLLYSVITITATFTMLLVIQRWGRHADWIGNLRVIRFTGPLIGVIPLLWIFNRDPWFLFAAQIFSGFLWAGFNLCSANFILDAVTPAKRVRCLAYFNLFNGLALSVGALVGGFLVRILPPLFGYRILTLFLLSGVLRMAIGFAAAFVKEVRPAQPVASHELLFSMVGIRPITGVERKTIRFE